MELQDYEISCIKEEILNVYNDNWSKYPECDCLLAVRWDIINKRALAHQEKLLPDIIAFNDALTAALRDFDAGFLRAVSDEQLIERWRIILIAFLVGFPQFIFALISFVILSVDFAQWSKHLLDRLGLVRAADGNVYEPEHEWIGVLAVGNLHSFTYCRCYHAEYGDGWELDWTVIDTYNLVDVLLNQLGQAIDRQLDIFMKTELAGLGL